MNKNYAMLPGTFDPPSFGHIDIIERAAKLYDKFYVVVGDNISKKTMFTADERRNMLVELVRHLGNVEVFTWSGAMVDFAKKHDVGVIVRGIRAINDFENEFELAHVYKQMMPELEILFMPTDSRLSMMRSSMIKEMALFGADISPFAPDLVCEEVKAKLMC